MNPTMHPGNHLKQILADRQMLQADLAFILGKSAPVINSITSGKSGISPEMSKALGEALGMAQDYFADLQKSYDLANASAPDPSVSLRANMMRTYPIRDMIKRGWIIDADAQNIQEQLASFFGVKSIERVPYLAHAAKKSKYEEREIPASQLTWLFRVKQIAKAMPVPKYSEQALTDALNNLSEMMIAPEAARHVPRILSECGVRYIIVESLPQAKIDGVCFWLDKQSPVIGMSTRYDRIDNYWFVLRHEIEHVLRRHGMGDEIVDDLDKRGTEIQELPPEEVLANSAAADFCVPTDKLESFLRRKYPAYYERDVLAFAKLHNIHPGMVVGQMQHKMNRYDYLRKYQVKIRQYILPGSMADGWGQVVPIRSALS